MYSYPGSNKEISLEPMNGGAQEGTDARYRDTSYRIAAVMADAGRRLCTLQIDVAGAGYAENALWLKTLLAINAQTAGFYADWPAFYEMKARRYARMMRFGIEIGAQAVIDINHLLAQSMVAAMSPLVETDARNDVAQAPQEGAGADVPEVFVERRVSAQVISFPERRISVLNSAMAQAAPPSVKRRRAA